MSIQVSIRQYISQQTASTGTNTTTLVIPNHNMNTGDSIVNYTRKSTNTPSSRVVTYIDPNTLQLNKAIPNQAAGDQIKLFHYNQKTIKKGSLNITNAQSYRNTCSFEMITTSADIPLPGQYVIVKYNGTVVYGGQIKDIDMSCISPGVSSTQKIIVKIKCEGYSSIPGRRTIQANFTNISSKNIIKNLVDTYLYQEGISYIDVDMNPGYYWEEYPPDNANDCISITQILNDCAEASGCDWFIDNNLVLRFKSLASINTPNAPYELLENGTFTDFRNVTINDTTIDYYNKIFVRGGSDSNSDMEIVWVQSDLEIEARQNSTGDSGVYGTIIESDKITSEEASTAGSGTTTTNLNIPNHPYDVNDVLYNSTRATRMMVLAVVDGNNITVEPVAGQTSGDIIKFYSDALVVAKTALKKYGKALPKTIEFDTFAMEFAPGQKLHVNLLCFGGSGNGYYLIEEVTITESGGYYEGNEPALTANVKGTLRDGSDFSAQPSPTAPDFFQAMANSGSGGSGGSTNVIVSPTPPTTPGGKLWVNSSTGVITKTANCTLTEYEADSIIQLYNAISVTLPTPSAQLAFKTFTFKSRDSNTKSIVGTIDGATNYSLAGNNKVLNVYCDGSGWFIWGVM